MSKILIAFFSRADENYFGGMMRYIKIGNTEIVVDMMQKMLEADTFKIEMKEPYAADYDTCIKQAKKDLKKKARPEPVRLPDSLDAYDTIILAYPNYGGTVPMVVATFLEHFDFTGKTMYPVCTHEGSGLGESEGDIRKMAKGVTLKPGLSITGSRAGTSKDAVEAYLRDSGLL